MDGNRIYATAIGERLMLEAKALALSLTLVSKFALITLYEFYEGHTPRFAVLNFEISIEAWHPRI